MQELLDQKVALERKITTAEDQIRQWRRQRSELTVKIFKTRTGIEEGQEYVINGNKIVVCRIDPSWDDATVYFNSYKKDGTLGTRQSRAWDAELKAMIEQLSNK